MNACIPISRAIRPGRFADVKCGSSRCMHLTSRAIPPYTTRPFKLPPLPATRPWEAVDVKCGSIQCHFVSASGPEPYLWRHALSSWGELDTLVSWGGPSLVKAVGPSRYLMYAVGARSFARAHSGQSGVHLPSIWWTTCWLRGAAALAALQPRAGG